MAKKDTDKTVLLTNTTNDRTFYVSEGRALGPKGADFFTVEEAERLVDLYPEEIIVPQEPKKPAASTKTEEDKK